MDDDSRVSGDPSIPGAKRARANLIISRNEDAADGDVSEESEFVVEANEGVVTKMIIGDGTNDAGVPIAPLLKVESSVENYCPDQWVDFRGKIRRLRSNLHDHPCMVLRYNLQERDRQDLVPLRCKTLHQILVSKEALKTALRSENIWEYTKSLLLEYFDPNIAVYCTVGGTNDAAWDQEDMRATLPAEALGIFLDHISIVAKEYYKTGVDEDIGDFEAGLKNGIEVHLKRLRDEGHNYDGPTEVQLREYRDAKGSRYTRKRRLQQ